MQAAARGAEPGFAREPRHIDGPSRCVDIHRCRPRYMDGEAQPIVPVATDIREPSSAPLDDDADLSWCLLELDVVALLEVVAPRRDADGRPFRGIADQRDGAGVGLENKGS